MDRFWPYVARKLGEQGTGSPAISFGMQPAVTVGDGAPTPQSVFHDAALRFLDLQVAINRDLDARTAQSFQVGSTVVTIAFGLLSLSRSQISVPENARLSLYGALVAYGLVLAFSFVATLYRQLEYRPDIPTALTYVTELSGADLQHWVALEYMSSSEVNRGKLRTKSRLIGAAVGFLYVEGACLAAAALFTLL